MRSQPHGSAFLAATCLIALLAVCLARAETATGGGASNPARVAGASHAASATNIPPSLFDRDNGRDPFFPSRIRITSTTPATSTNPAAAALPPSLFVLNGITGPPKRTAMVNGTTLEVGEEANVRLRDGGKISVRCLGIRDDSIVIEVGANPPQRIELRLRFGL